MTKLIKVYSVTELLEIFKGHCGLCFEKDCEHCHLKMFMRGIAR